MKREAVHVDPIWRERANFIIATSIEPGDTIIDTEQLWARRIDECHFELCCIPFFAYDLALGDVVEVDEHYMVKRVTRPSGRYVFRVHLNRDRSGVADVMEGLESRGALVEWSSPGLFAVDGDDLPAAQAIADYLIHLEGRGVLVYETGKRT